MLTRHFTRAARAAVHLVLATWMLLWLGACEEDVTAVIGTELPYSLYGVISPQLDSQWVRVFPIEERLSPAEPEPIDATVTSTDLTTGEQFVWRDSVIIDFADQFAHVFWAPFQARHGHTYQIESRRSDGAVTSVEVAVPPESQVDLEPPEFLFDGVILPVLIPGDIPRVLRAEVQYAVAFRPVTAVDNVTARVTIPYDDEPHEVAEGWRIPINLGEDHGTVLGELNDLTDDAINSAVGVILLNITVRLIVGNEEWSPPNNRFDPELIVQPGVLSNVRGGFGFVGAGYRLVRQWTPPAEVIERTRFRALEES